MKCYIFRGKSYTYSAYYIEMSEDWISSRFGSYVTAERTTSGKKITNSACIVLILVNDSIESGHLVVQTQSGTHICDMNGWWSPAKIENPNITLLIISSHGSSGRRQNITHKEEQSRFRGKMCRSPNLLWTRSSWRTSILYSSRWLDPLLRNRQLALIYK